jgi:hypothetical protein
VHDAAVQFVVGLMDADPEGRPETVGAGVVIVEPVELNWVSVRVTFPLFVS